MPEQVPLESERVGFIGDRGNLGVAYDDNPYNQPPAPVLFTGTHTLSELFIH